MLCQYEKSFYTTKIIDFKSDNFSFIMASKIEIGIDTWIYIFFKCMQFLAILKICFACLILKDQVSIPCTRKRILIKIK